MRLTLRTLLAYLDDTLEPHEIKEIGQKVAESDAAQELVARIKQITRRRRLTTPPANGFDANTVAEYLDNELSSDLVADLEKTCLESDVHLAEVASCHQILTLVLGEPALVPPTARERMYGLVKGREAIPFRKARARAGADDGGHGRDADDPLLPGMPSSRGWLVWALPLAALLVLAVLAVAVWQGLSDSRPPLHVAAANNDKTNTPPETPVTPVVPVETPAAEKTLTGKVTMVEGGRITLKGDDDKETELTVPADAKVVIDGADGKLENVKADSTAVVTSKGDAVTRVEATAPAAPPPAETTVSGKATKIAKDGVTLQGADGKETAFTIPADAKVLIDGKEGKLENVRPGSTIAVTRKGDVIVAVEARSANARPQPPSKERAVVGRFVVPPRAGPSVLVRRQADQPGWKRILANGSPVSSTEDLVSLPGYISELDLGADGGARLLLRGNVREFSFAFPIMDFLMESAVRLYKPEAGFDADLTLDRGRIFLSSRRQDGPVKVRLRFAGEVWDVTLLEPETEVGVDLLQAYTPGIDYRDEKPLEALHLAVLSGRAGVATEARDFPSLKAPIALFWDNKGTGIPEPVRRLPPEEWDKWAKNPPPASNEAEKKIVQDMREALDKVSLNMTDKKAVETALTESRQTSDSTMTRVLAVYCFGAVDAPDKLLDVLCTDEDPLHYADRNAAVFTLRRWVSRDPDNGDLLYDMKKKTAGRLLDQKYHYQDDDAKIILDELHDFPPREARDARTFQVLTNQLRSRVLPIRELAYWHLLHLSVGARVKRPDYDAADDADRRNAAADAWQALIGKELPPPLPMAPGQ